MSPAVADDLNEAGLRGDERRERWMIFGLCSPSLLIVVLGLIVPVGWLFWLSFVGADGTVSMEMENFDLTIVGSDTSWTLV